ncbi:MAG TPA: hypothetical protein VF713_07120 [Thermoanaerobaculia bacterium]
MFSFFIFAIAIIFAILFLSLAAKRNSIDALERTVNRLHSKADEDERKLDDYQREIDRQKTLRATEGITRISAQHQSELERAARDARLKVARNAADAIRARIGGAA